MDKLELMKKFSSTFVGNGFHLVIREDKNSFLVHTIEIMQKTDETCPVKRIAVGDYFFHLVASNRNDEEASIVCDWSQELLQNLLETYTSAKEAGQTHIEMIRNPMTDGSERLDAEVEQPRRTIETNPISPSSLHLLAQHFASIGQHSRNIEPLYRNEVNFKDPDSILTLLATTARARSFPFSTFFLHHR